MTSPVPTASRHLKDRQLAAIEKIGDCLIPGDGDLPRFSATGCAREIDRILDYMPERDLADLKTLLALLGWFPRFAVALVLRFLEWSPWLPEPVGSLARLVRFGLRGLAMSLYYSDPKVLALIGYEVGVYTGDFKPYAGPGASPSPRPKLRASEEAVT